MPRATFTVPDIQSKTVSKNTLSIYKSKLNKLAQEDITTVSEVLQNQDKVIDIAKKETGGDKNKMRLFLSAVFYACADVPLETKLKLYNEFQNHKDEPYRKFVKGTPLIEDEEKEDA